MNKRRIFAVTAGIVLAVNAFSSPAEALEPCIHEDGSGQGNCTWNAAVQGNGQGQSYDVIDGEPVYHHADQAWALWDAVGASSLLPDSPVMVAYAGHSLTPFPLTADTITVWDNAGNHYLFTVTDWS